MAAGPLKPATEPDIDTTHIEQFRHRVIRAMAGLRVVTDEYECVDLVDLDAVLDAIRATPAVIA